jgi:hypothetical protein
MGLRRYNRTPLMSAGRQYATPRTIARLQKGIASGRIACRQHVCTELERLDILAGKRYNDSRLWWVIAAASGIGWALQVPPGTRLLIPIKLSDIARIVG